MASDRPSFIVFTTDQHRWDLLGCAGHPALRTPNLDRLAARGVRFDRCHTNHPLCMPTRATWFTGQTTRGHGVRCNGIPLDRSLPTMTGALCAAGYRTHSVGKVHLRPFGTLKDADPASLDPVDWPESGELWKRGRVAALPMPYYGLQSADYIGHHGTNAYGDYRTWLLRQESDADRLWREADDRTGEGPETVWTSKLPEELHYCSYMAARAGDFLRDRARDGQPFFLWQSCPDPHPPYTCAPRWAEMYDPADMPLPTRREGELDDLPPHYRTLYEHGGKSAGRFAPCTVPDEQVRRVRAMVCAMVGQIDHMVGSVLDEAERLGLLDNTVVVFMADHGNMLGDHWMFNMPPCHLDGATRVPSIWSLPGAFREGAVSDALVSHLDFAPTVLDLAGVPIPEGETPATPECEAQLPPWPGHSLRPVLTGEAEAVQDAVIIENDEDYQGDRLRTLVTQDAYLTVYPGRPYGELFHLREDPAQLHNLWDDPARRGLRLEMQARLLEKLALTDSRLPRRLCHA